MERLHYSQLTAALVLITAVPSLADDFDTERFSLRLGSSLFRLSTYPDVVAKTGADAASVEIMTFNPAGLAWDRLSPFLLERQNLKELTDSGLSAQALNIRFQNDTEFSITAQSMVWFNSPIGAIRFSMVQLRSNEEPARGGELRENIFEYDLNAYRFEWAHRFGTEKQPSRIAIGASLSYNQSEVNVFLPQTTLLQKVSTDGIPLGEARVSTDRSVLTDVNRDTFNVRLGWQVSLVRRTTERLIGCTVCDVPNDDRLLWGMAVDYSHYLTKQTTHVPTVEVTTESGSLPPQAIDAVRAGAAANFPAESVSRHTSHSVVTRTGLAWKFWPERDEDAIPGAGKTEGTARRIKPGAGWLHADYQWSWFRDEVAEFQDHRLHVGVDIPIGRALTVSAGIVTDDRRHVSWAAGLKLQAITTDWKSWEKTGIDAVILSLAYQHDPLPELGAEFGHSQLWAFALGFAF